MALTEQQKKNRKQGGRATDKQSATEAQRLAAERARKRKFNPNGTLRKEFEAGYGN